MDTQTHQVTADRELLDLSAREFALLEILLLQVGKVVSKDRISQRLASMVASCKSQLLLKTKN